VGENRFSNGSAAGKTTLIVEDERFSYLACAKLATLWRRKYFDLPAAAFQYPLYLIEDSKNSCRTMMSVMAG
jgi:hypothetical protein